MLLQYAGNKIMDIYKLHLKSTIKLTHLQQPQLTFNQIKLSGLI